MALHLNLYHEVHKQQRARKRDPLKLGMLGVLVVLLGFAGYYFVRLAEAREVGSRLAVVEAEYQAIEPKEKQAKEREAELNANIALSNALVKKVENRYYWAPVIERFMEAVPREIQLTRFEATHSTDKGKSTAITVSGISTGPEPRRVAEDLRTTLEDKLAEENATVSSSFKLLEDSEEKVQLDGAAMPSATFTIQLDVAWKAEAEPVKREPKKS